MFRTVLFVMLFIVPAAAQTPAPRQVALVVGIGAYQHLPALTNPANDAALIGGTLKELGFSLVGGAPQLNLDKAGFDRAVQQFGVALQNAEIGVFYYAGHGLQVQGTNWLVPTGANPSTPQDLDFQMVDAELVLKQMQFAKTRLNVMILDACRNNPFGGRGLRATGGGLAEMRAPEGTLIAYATQPGNVAQDGAGANSPFSTALATTLRQPGYDVFRLFNQVGLTVKRATNGYQQPWVSSSPIDGDFYFSGIAPGDAPRPAADPDTVFWQSIANSTDPADYRAYLQQFPSGRFAELAQRRAEPPAPKPQLQAMVVPPIQPPSHDDRPAQTAATGLVLYAAAVRAIEEYTARAAVSYAEYTAKVNPDRGPSGRETDVSLVELKSDIWYVDALKQALAPPSGSRAATTGASGFAALVGSLQQALAQQAGGQAAVVDYAELPEPAENLPAPATDRAVAATETLPVLAQRYVAAAEALHATIEPARLYYDQHDERDDHFAKGRAMHPPLMAAFRNLSTASAALRSRLETMSAASREAYLNALPPDTRQARMLVLRNLDHARQLTRYIVAGGNGWRDWHLVNPASLKLLIDPVEQSLNELRQFASERPANADLLFDRGRMPDAYFNDCRDLLGRSKALWRGLRDHKPPDFTGFTMNGSYGDPEVEPTLSWINYHFNNLVFHVNDNR